jgi:hypothetical protein
MGKAAIRPGATLVTDFVFTQQKLPTHKPIVQYIRQSSVQQLKRNKQSYELQDTDLRRKLTRGYGWADNDEMIIKINIDQGKSGTKRRDERTGLDQLYTLLETGKAGAVAAFDVSRLYRVLSRAEYGKFCDMVLELNIPVVTDARVYWPTRVDNDQLNDDFRAAAMFIEEIIKGKLIASKNRHIQYDVSYGGHNHPFGFIVSGIGDELALKKSYVVYEPHAVLIRWLFKRYKELGGNLPMLFRELERIDFRFPPFEDGIVHHVGLREASDGSYPLRTREAIVGILCNTSYIGWYQYHGVVVSKEAHPAIVHMDDFLFAYERLSGTSLDGTETQERKPRERRYGANSAFLAGIVHSDDMPVYILKHMYTARREIGAHLTTTELAVEENAIDGAFNRVFNSLVRNLKQEDRMAITQALAVRFREQVKKSDQYTKDIARIDGEIRKEEMAQSVSKELGDEQGYRVATVQLVQLRKDRAEIQYKLDHADSEADDLLEASDIIDQLMADSIANLKKLAKVLILDANMTEASPHFIRLDITFGTPINKSVTIYIYRANGSRGFWNDEKDDMLRRVYSSASASDIMAALPAHTWNGIRQRARELGLRRELPGAGYTTLTHSDKALMEATGASMGIVTWTVKEQERQANQVQQAILVTVL